MAKSVHLIRISKKLRREKKRRLTCTVSVRVTKEEKKALKWYAEQNRVTVSDLLRIALEPVLGDLVTIYHLKGGKHEDNDNIPRR